MKFAAHPLVVAAALGLLGPSALEGVGESSSPRPQANAPDPRVRPAEPLSEPIAAYNGLLDARLYTVEAPAEEDLARVAREWEQITNPDLRHG